MFTIGLFAELTGVSAKRLRHYDRIGLFAPAFVDPATKYRHYTATQIPRLRRIVSLADMGFALREISDLVDAGPVPVDVALQRRRREMIDQRADLNRRLAALDIELSHGSEIDVVIQVRPPGRWASLRRRLDDGADLSPLFVEVESMVREQDLRARRPPAAVDHGLIGSQRDVEVLIPTSGSIVARAGVRNMRTPPAQIAATLVLGEYPSLSEASATMSDWVTGTGYRIGGPTWISYLRFSAEPHLGVPGEFLTDEPNYVSEIQVQVD